MVATAGNSSATVKSTASGSLGKSKIQKSERKLLQNDRLLSRLSFTAAVTRSFLETNDLILPPYQSLRLESLLSSLPIAPSHCSTSTSWFQRLVNSAVDEDDPRWRICFRMSKPTFFNLLSILTPTDSPSLAATIFRLAHNASYKYLLLRFGFASVADASRVFFTVCKLINEKLGLLGDPRPDYSPRLLPNCCGVLGFGRFHLHDGKLPESLIVQALVDSTGKFSDISAGWPSTMTPDAIFRQTKLFSESKSFLNGAPCRLGNGISVPRYILGDSCLPLLPWLVTPYSSNQEEEEDGGEFSNVIKTALGTVEIVFAKVRARWQILDRKWKPETLEFLPFVLTTGCLLHNFLVDSGDDDLQEEWVDDGEMRKDEDYEVETSKSEGEAFSRIRDAIAEILSRSTKYRQGIRAAFEAEKQRVDNQSKIDTTVPKNSGEADMAI